MTFSGVQVGETGPYTMIDASSYPKQNKKILLARRANLTRESNLMTYARPGRELFIAMELDPSGKEDVPKNMVLTLPLSSEHPGAQCHIHINWRSGTVEGIDLTQQGRSLLGHRVTEDMIQHEAGRSTNEIQVTLNGLEKVKSLICDQMGLSPGTFSGRIDAAQTVNRFLTSQDFQANAQGILPPPIVYR